ncbi:hypothetical protein [Massilia aquatica]|uniref:Uncharacterized protein n=1 Tax=Massilia aquatica TaxID=2609000 RepID=A0ABX0MAH5_9BURK|nr:hypothetical protein [Massilia aquatica]NHZ44201.1 hypothetical protein [Massilia aquatica]
MHIGKMKLRAWLGALSLVLVTGAQAQVQDLGTAIQGKYTLVSSTTTPDSAWKFTKARLEISRLDKRHIQIAMACDWWDAPTAQCDAWWAVQVRDGGLYLHDLNTEETRLRFDPSAHTITITSGTAGKVGSVRTDVFELDPAPEYDKALIRRMKRAHWAGRQLWSPASPIKLAFPHAISVGAAK